MKLTGKGKKVLGISDAESSRHGGAAHQYWVKRIADHLRTCGYKVAEEAPIGGGKAVDILAAKDGRRIAFEIETGKSDAAANVRKCLEAGFSKVVVVASSAAVRDALEKSLAGRRNVRVMTGPEALARISGGPAGPV